MEGEEMRNPYNYLLHCSRYIEEYKTKDKELKK